MLDIFLHSYKFQREIIKKKKSNFRVGNKEIIATKSKLIWLNILVLLHAKRKLLKHSFPFFLEKFLWIRVAVTSNLWKIASSRFLFYPNFPRNFFIIPLVVTSPPFFFYRTKTRDKMQLYVSPSGMTSIPAALIL